MQIEKYTNTGHRIQNSGIPARRHRDVVAPKVKTVFLLSALCAGLMGCAETDHGTVSSDRIQYEPDMSDLNSLSIRVPGM
ncbi:hypothetical protein [Pseudohalocynthiibacter sp. F2068]|uniref:hypothetical protein n=1 Tax=Pseudohalocynthiibacter sp. F2068 TaxID=2926418 RepID=UPI001FF65940|nr:hypothetical protein [Pseudohalocynthiibacter sp. F2068]MCK0101178.1 hypothetical protein [Pseudohalocynthiibacter sp. F2068]